MIVILDLVRGRRMVVLRVSVVFIVVIAVAPRVNFTGLVVVNMVVRLVVLLIPVIVLSFGIVRIVITRVIIGLVFAIKLVMVIDYELSRVSTIVIIVMVDPLALMVIITLIFATVVASVRVGQCVVHVVVEPVQLLRMSSSMVKVEPKALPEVLLDLNILVMVVLWLHLQDEVSTAGVGIGRVEHASI